MNQPSASNELQSSNESKNRSERLLDQIEQLTAIVEANEQNQRIQQAVFRIAKVACDAGDMESFYAALHNIVKELTSTDAFFIALYHEQESALSFPYYEDQYDDVQIEDETPLKNRGLIPIEKCQSMMTWTVIENNDVLRVVDVASSNISSLGKHAQDWIGIPLRRDGRPIGVFSIQSYQPGFRYTDEEVDLMEFISHHISSALQHRKDNEALRQANETLRCSTEELAAANDQLKHEMAERQRITASIIELSHQAGKAEIATGILHNVGNVLNSINVAAGIVDETLRSSKIESLVKTAELLDSQNDLGAFFTTDPRGAAFLPYFSKLASRLVEERDQATHELSTMKKHLEHVKTVVAMQQSYAGISGLKERVDLPNLFSDAELLIASSLTRHAVEITREFESLPELMLEKQKLLQVIVNLLKNAKDAMTAGRKSDRQLHLKIARSGSDEVQIEVKDNGTGIAPEHLNKLFMHGFTTKSDGHGFGLHSCANAVKDMGGHLSVASEGIGQGATFTIKLPFHPAEDSRC